MRPLSTSANYIFTQAAIFFLAFASTAAQTPIENAQAWEISVASSIKLQNLESKPIFSRDFRQALYLENTDNVLNLKTFDLESCVVVKTIKLWNTPPSIDMVNLAISPDGHKVAFDMDRWPEHTNLFFVDLDTSKVTGIKVDPGFRRIQLCWLLPSSLDELGPANDPAYRLDLDTLQISYLPTAIAEAERSFFRAQTNQNCFLSSGPLEPKNYRPDWQINSHKRPYSQVLFNYGTWESGIPLGVIWSPDLRYILVRQINRDGWTKCALLLKLGLRPAPTLDFEIKDVEQRLASEQLALIKKAFGEKKKIWANVYGPRLNPLNNKVVGPDEENYKGQGFLSEISPKLKFSFSYEVKPATAGDVIAVFQVENDWNWRDQVWAEIGSN